MADIQRRQAEVQKLQAENVVYMQESMRVHDQRMNHVDMRLAEITDKLDGLIGFMGGYFKGPNSFRRSLLPREQQPGPDFVHRTYFVVHQTH